MKDSKDVHAIPMSELRPHIETHGSVRLVNCFRFAIASHCIPYEFLGDYLSDSFELRIKKLKQIPNVGNSTAFEFNRLAENYVVENVEPIDGELSDPKVRLATPLYLIQPYIDTYGGERLKNCVNGAIADSKLPYESCEAYLTDPLSTRLVKLRRIRNLGTKTALEFNQFVEAFAKLKGIGTTGGDSRGGITPGASPSEPASDELEPEIPQGVTLEERYSNLSPREKEVIERRFAIDRNVKQTLADIAGKYDVTRERIRQIESKALRKMGSTRILQSWELFVNENKDKLLDAVFYGDPTVKKPPVLLGELGLSIKIVFGSMATFLKDNAQRYQNWWVKPEIDLLQLQTARNRLSTGLGIAGAVPLSVGDAAKQLQVSVSIVQAAISMLDGFKIFNGWIIHGNASSRKKRIVNLLNLFHAGRINSPASLWGIKVAYWKEFADDNCTGRDLLLCLQDHCSHFINLRELGWVCLAIEQSLEGKGLDLSESYRKTPEELYTRPVKTGHGLANCVYELFEKHGPQRLSDAAAIFQKEYPQYAVSSMYPMLVYFAVFLRLAPGIMAIQAHWRDPSAIWKARKIMLGERDLDLYLLSRTAGSPELRYPLWDLEMEILWAKWLVDNGDRSRLGSLLSVASIDKWEVDETAREKWKTGNCRLNGRVYGPPLRMFSERNIDISTLTTAIVAASISGDVTWMYLNQALGWRIETTRVGVVLAVLVHMGVLKPTGAWNETHHLTNRGQEIANSIFDRKPLQYSERSKTMKDFLNDTVGVGVTELGWASAYSYDQLLCQITGVAGEVNEKPSANHEEDPDVEMPYDGFMGDVMRELIDG